MKKYLIKILCFFAIMAVVDLAFGKTCTYLRDHTKGGFSGNVHYICESCSEDIIMMGSSRMKHHYAPKPFEDSLGMTCYNAGIDGNGIILNYGFLRMMLHRYNPSLIIYDVSSYDMFKDDNSKYLDMLRPYYSRDGIADIFDDVDPIEHWKMKSMLYRYNSKLLGLLTDNFHPVYSFEKGYMPLHGVMDYYPAKPVSSQTPEVDSLKLNYLEKFIALARQHNVQVVFTTSPTYYGKLMQGEHNPVKMMCNKYGIQFIDHYYDSEICSSMVYWKDGTHMNADGARLFSSKLAGELSHSCFGQM